MKTSEHRTHLKYYEQKSHRTSLIQCIEWTHAIQIKHKSNLTRNQSVQNVKHLKKINANTKLIVYESLEIMNKVNLVQNVKHLKKINANTKLIVYESLEIMNKVNKQNKKKFLIFWNFINFSFIFYFIYLWYLKYFQICFCILVLKF